MEILYIAVIKFGNAYKIELIVDKQPKNFIEEYNKQVPFFGMDISRLIEAIKKDLWGEL